MAEISTYPTQSPPISLATRLIGTDANGATVNTTVAEIAGSALAFDSVATATAAVIPAANTTIQVNGFATPGDGGGGTYIQAAAGAGPGKFQSDDGQWWLLTIPAEGVSIVALGAVDDGATDCGPALQATHDLLPASGGAIIVPGAVNGFALATGASFTKPVRLRGAGRAMQGLNITANITGIAAHAWLGVEDLSLNAPPGLPGYQAATLLQFSGSGTDTYQSYVKNCQLQGAATCINQLYAEGFSVENNVFRDYTAAAVAMSNSTSSDGGDSFIRGNSFLASPTSIRSVHITATSGLRITDNKFNGHAVGHIDFDWTTNVVGDFTIANNSVEGYVSYGLRLAGSPGGACVKTIVDSNQFSSSSPTLGHIVIGAGRCQNWVLSDNIINGNGLGGDIAINITDDTAINGEIDGGQIYGVTQAIAAPANDIGINIKSMPRIGDGGTNTNDKVSVIWSGGSTLTNNANGRTIDLSTTLNASGNTTATNVYAVHAIYGGLLTVTMTGIVQGVGLTSFQNSYAVLGGAATPVSTVTPTGGLFDPVITTTTGNVTIGAKCDASSPGTSVLVTCEIQARGNFDLVARL